MLDFEVRKRAIVTGDDRVPDSSSLEISTTKPGWRRRLLVLGSAVVGAVIAAWWCFRQPAIATVPGTVHVERFDDARVFQVVSHPDCGRAAFLMSGPWMNAMTRWEFQSEQWPTIDLLAPTGTSSSRPLLGGFQTGAILEDRSGRIAIVGLNGMLAVRESDGRVRRFVLTQPKIEVPLSGNGKTFVDFIVQDVAWHDDRLVVVGWSYLGGTVMEPHRLIYDVSVGDSVDPVLIPEVDASLNPKAVDSSLSRDGTHWAAIEFVALNRTIATQKLTLSDGATVDLPVETVGQGGSQTSSIYFEIVGDPAADRISLLRMTADHEHIELVEVPLNESAIDVRPPLQLPTRYINTDVSRVSDDGRYVVLCSGDYSRMRFPWLSSVIPQLAATSATHDLVLVDLVEWRVAASERVRFSSLGKDLPTAWYRPAVSHDNEHVLVPQGDRYSVVDIDEWILEAESR